MTVVITAIIHVRIKMVGRTAPTGMRIRVVVAVVVVIGAECTLTD